MNDAIVYCDGACEPVNPGGVATYGWVAYWKKQIRAKDCGVVCEGEGATNNVAEYSALIQSLKYFLSKGFRGPLTVKSDSQLLVNQMTGKWGVKSESIRPYYQEAKQLAAEFTGLEFVWIPREMNIIADALSKQAYDNHRRGQHGR